MNLPNRKYRRKLAKDLGLLKNKKRGSKKIEEIERAQAIGRLIRLRNLTELRNQNKKSE